MKDRRKMRPGMEDYRVGGARLQTINIVMIAVVVVAAGILLYGINRMTDNYHQLRETTDTYLTCQKAAQDLMDASDYLTNQARSFSVTGEIEFLNNYFNESENVQRRDKALASLESHLPDSEALEYLKRAMDESIALMDREYYSMRLVIEAKGYDIGQLPDDLQHVKITAKDSTFTPAQMMDRARSIMFDNAYESEKDKITEGVEKCVDQILRGVEDEQNASFARMERTLWLVIILIAIMLILFIILGIIISSQIVRPLRNSIDCINDKIHLPMKGAFELQYLASVYNRMFDENKEHNDLLAYEALHDRLTGAYNRAGFEERFTTCDKDSIALILIDVDEFKSINDTYGHSVGDLILKKVVNLIREYFRAEDYICRIGGDEFAVIMIFADSSMKPQVVSKINAINDHLQHPAGSLPPTSLSVGVAFGDRKNPTSDMFKDADAALYQTKEAGRNGCSFYGEEDEKQGE